MPASPTGRQFVRSGHIIDDHPYGTTDPITSDEIEFAVGDTEVTFFIESTQDGSLQVQINSHEDTNNPGSVDASRWENLGTPTAYTAGSTLAVPFTHRLPRTRVVFTPGAAPGSETVTVFAQGSGVR